MANCRNYRNRKGDVRESVIMKVRQRAVTFIIRQITKSSKEIDYRSNKRDRESVIIFLR